MKIKNKLTENTIAMAIVAAFVLLMMTACSTDTGNTPKPINEKSLAGVWHMKSSTINGNPTGSKFDVTFTEDKKAFLFTDNGYVKNSGTYTLTNQKLDARYKEPKYMILIVDITSITDHELKWKKQVSNGLLEETFTK